MTTATGEERNLDLSVLRCAAGTDVGMRRDENQDSFGIVKGERFQGFFVADGMGGVHGGAVASRIAVSGLEDLLPSAFVASNPDTLVEVVRAINVQIFERGSSDPTLAGMGTTLVGVVFTPNGGVIVNVGDSRIYRVRGNEISQLSEDHTLVRELLKSGAITADQAESHPASHMLTRSLGPVADVQVDCRALSEWPEVGDFYVLCSDGLYNFVSDQEMLDVVRQNPLDDANQILINLANQRGGADNITVLIVSVGDQVGRGRSAAYRQARDASASKQGSSQSAVEERGSDAPEAQAETAEQGSSSAKAASPDASTSTAQARPPQDDRASDVASEPVSSTRGPDAANAKPVAAPQVEEPRPQRIKTARRAEAPQQTSFLRRSIPVWFLLAAALVFGLVVGSVTRRYVPFANVSEFLAMYLPDGEETAPPIDSNPRRPSRTDPDASLLDRIDTKPDLPPLSSTRGPEVPNVGVSDSSLIGENSSPEGNGQSTRARMLETKKVFQASIAKLEEQLVAFGKPVSPEVGAMVVKLRKQADELSVRQAEIQQSMDAASRKISQWFIRQKRLESQDAIQLAAEVGASSDVVQQKKRALETATYEFIAKRDEFELYPSNDRLRQEVEQLKEKRAQMLRSLQAEIENTVKAVLNETEQQLYELKFQRNMLDLQIQSVMQDLEFAKTIAEPNQEQRQAMAKKIEQKLRGLKASLVEIDSMLSSGRDR